MANDKNRAKRAKNQALQVDTLREARTKSGVEEELRNLKHGYTINDGAITNAHQGDATTNNRVLASNAVSTSKIGDGQVHVNKIDPTYVGGSQDESCLRLIGRDSSWASKGTSTRSASADHVHSTSFKALSREERRYYIALADKIAAHKSKDPELVELREMLLFIFRLQADDIDVTAKERERIIDEHPEGDRLEHELWMQHDYVYGAQHELRTDPWYRYVAKKPGMGHVAEIAREMDEIVETDETFALLHEVDEETGELLSEHRHTYQKYVSSKRDTS